MNILIVAATINEVEPLLKEIGAVEKTGGRHISVYKSIKIAVLITGVGMVRTAYSLGKTLSTSYDAAINLGVAGAFNRNLDLGTVVNITSDRFADLGAEDGEEFITLAQMGLEDPNEFPYEKGEIVNVSFVSNEVVTILPKVSGITVNKVHGNEKSIETTVNRYHPYVESMEGAAFLFACLKEKIPAVQVRAVSNYVEKRNREAWNLPLAITNLNKTALDILNAF